MTAYSKTTEAIQVSVEPHYLADQSVPADNHYVWAYSVTIENQGDETLQLLNRYWCITDAQGQMQEVRGAGVVGEQPVLKPGDSFDYTSGTPLQTPSGIMVGHYEFEREDGLRKIIDIPAFSLDSPHQARIVN